MDDFKVVRGVSPSEVKEREAREFVSLVKTGETPQEAALTVGTPLPVLLKQPSVQNWIERVLPYHIKDPNLRRNVVIGAMTEILATGESDRDKVAAARILIADPELGFGNAAPQVNVTISDDVRKMDVGIMWPSSNDNNGKPNS